MNNLFNAFHSFMCGMLVLLLIWVVFGLIFWPIAAFLTPFSLISTAKLTLTSLKG